MIKYHSIVFFFFWSRVFSFFRFLRERHKVLISHDRQNKQTNKAPMESVNEEK
jgi:hypothetical protein